MEDSAYDRLELRCPRLGGEVTFAYCQREGGDLPCPRSIACWQPHFPVETYLKTRLTRQQWARCFEQRPKEKLVTLIELIEAAKNQPEVQRQSSVGVDENPISGEEGTGKQSG